MKKNIKKKRLVILMMFSTIFANEVSAESHWLLFEINPIPFSWMDGFYSGFGLRYEYVIFPSFTVGGYSHFNFPLGYKGISFGLGAFGRWYPNSVRFFMEVGLGYGHQRLGYKTHDYSYKEVQNGFDVVPGFGWTIDIGKRGGFYISPGLKVPLTIGKTKRTDEESFSYGYKTVHKKYNSLNFFLIGYFGLGVTF